MSNPFPSQFPLPPLPSQWQPASPWNGGSARVLAKARLRLALARWIHLALLLCVGMGIALGAVLQLDWLALLALLAAMVWILLLVRSARMVRRVRDAWAATQMGRHDIAEARAREVIDAWSLLRPVTVSAVQVLASAAHGAGRHAEAAELAAFVAMRHERLLVGDRTGARLLMVESLLAIDRPAEAHAAAMPLYASKLPLADALRLLGLQVRMEARYGAWQSICERLSSKVDMAELMPPAESATVQALLGLAAAEQGLAEWAAWLWKRVNLLADWDQLQKSDPLLAGVDANFARVVP